MQLRQSVSGLINLFLVIVLYALFAGVFTFAKIALDYSQPFFLIGSRMLFAGGLMTAGIWWFSKERIFLTRRALFRTFQVGLITHYLTNSCELWGLQFLTTFKTCFLYSLSPYLSAFFCYLLFKEIISPKKWLGLITGFCGLLPVLLSQTTEEELSGLFGGFSLAELSVLGAVVFSVYGWILLGQLVKEDNVSPILANGLSMLMGGILAIGHSLCVETWTPLPVTELVPFLGYAVLLIILSNILCYNLYGYLLQKFSATFMSFAGFSTPFFTAFFGYLFLGESLTPTFFISNMIVFSGLVLFYQEELKTGLEGMKGWIQFSRKPKPQPSIT